MKRQKGNASVDGWAVPHGVDAPRTARDALRDYEQRELRSESVRPVAWAIAFALSFAALLSMAAPVSAAEKLAADRASAAALANDIVLIDIRTPAEWADTGVPDAAEALDMRDPDFLTKLQAITAAAPSRPVALICATGGRSAFVVSELEKRGYSGLLDVSEGMFGSNAGPGWLARDLPVRSPEQAVATGPDASSDDGCDAC